MRKSAEAAAAGKLATRSMATEELAVWLRDKGYDEEEIRNVIDSFTETGYLNDERYSREFVSYAVGRRHGKKRIIRDLLNKGVDREVAENAYDDQCAEEGSPSESDLAREEAEKVLRMADIGPDDEVPEKIRGRIARRLERNGFGGSIIVDVLESMRR